MLRYRYCAATAVLAALVLAGCDGGSGKPPAAAVPPTETAPDEVAAERAKLDPADRALVDAQEWCVVNADERLGSMGPPIKLEIGGQSLFICCKGCRRKAEADPAATLAKLETLKVTVQKGKVKE